MAITTNNGKLAIIEFEDVWEPGLPMVATDTISEADQVQFLWGFPEILYTAFVRAAAALVVYVMPGTYHLSNPNRLHTTSGVLYLVPSETLADGTVVTTKGVVTLAGTV